MTEDTARKLCTHAKAEGYERIYFFGSKRRKVTFDDRWPRLPVREGER